MTEKKKWFTTREIFKNAERCDFSGMRKAECFDCTTVGERWLSSEAAAQLAKRLYIAKRILNDSLLHDDERTRVEELLYEVAQELTRNNERART